MDLLNSEAWEKRLEEARAQRQRALAAKEPGATPENPAPMPRPAPVVPAAARDPDRPSPLAAFRSGAPLPDDEFDDEDDDETNVTAFPRRTVEIAEPAVPRPDRLRDALAGGSAQRTPSGSRGAPSTAPRAAVDPDPAMYGPLGAALARPRPSGEVSPKVRPPSQARGSSRLALIAGAFATGLGVGLAATVLPGLIPSRPAAPAVVAPAPVAATPVEPTIRVAEPDPGSGFARPPKASYVADMPRRARIFPLAVPPLAEIPVVVTARPDLMHPVAAIGLAPMAAPEPAAEPRAQGPEPATPARPAPLRALAEAGAAPLAPAPLGAAARPVPALLVAALAAPGVSETGPLTRAAPVEALAAVPVAPVPPAPEMLDLADPVRALRPAALTALAVLSAPAGGATPAAPPWAEIPRTAPHPGPVILAPSAPDAPLPGALALPPAPPLPMARVDLYVPSEVPDERVAELTGALTGVGYELDGPQRVGFAISETNVRFYHRDDAAAAEVLAAQVGGVARDFTSAGKRPPAGHVELWLGGEGNGSKRTATTVRRSSSAKKSSAAATTARLKQSLIRKLRQARGE